MRKKEPNNGPAHPHDRTDPRRVTPDATTIQVATKHLEGVNVKPSRATHSETLDTERTT